MKIAIDCGHGLPTPGKRVPDYPGLNHVGTKEWTLNQRVGITLSEILQNTFEDMEIWRLDDKTGRTDALLKERAAIANDYHVDIVFCIHHNAGIKGGTGGGPCVFYYNKDERKQQAEYLYNRIIEETYYKGDRVSPVMPRNDLYMISHCTAPVFYIERLFMDSVKDNKMLLDDNDIKRFCAGICNFVYAWRNEGWK